MRSVRKTIENIILINPMLGALQKAIEREQDGVIADLDAPAEKTVKRLIELDNRRIDLCNLQVLYGFMERGLGERFELLRACASAGLQSALYAVAVRQLAYADYDTERVNREFDYLFKVLPKRKKGRGNYNTERETRIQSAQAQITCHTEQTLF